MKSSKLAIDRAKKLFGATWANVQPQLCGVAQANDRLVFLALLESKRSYFRFLIFLNGGH